eukprot:3290464-Rhodomonas_salina.1
MAANNLVYNTCIESNSLLLGKLGWDSNTNKTGDAATGPGSARVQYPGRFWQGFGNRNTVGDRNSYALGTWCRIPTNNEVAKERASRLESCITVASESRDFARHKPILFAAYPGTRGYPGTPGYCGERHYGGMQLRRMRKHVATLMIASRSFPSQAHASCQVACSASCTAG